MPAYVDKSAKIPRGRYHSILDVCTDIAAEGTISRNAAIAKMQKWADTVDISTRAGEMLRSAFQETIQELKDLPSNDPADHDHLDRQKVVEKMCNRAEIADISGGKEIYLYKAFERCAIEMLRLPGVKTVRN